MGMYSRGKREKINGLCKLFWVVDNKVREELFKDSPVSFGLACYKADILERTTHKYGKVDVVSVNEVPYQQTKLFNQPS
jgi:hypothetical protein